MTRLFNDPAHFADEAVADRLSGGASAPGRQDAVSGVNG